MQVPWGMVTGPDGNLYIAMDDECEVAPFQHLPRSCMHWPHLPVVYLQASHGPSLLNAGLSIVSMPARPCFGFCESSMPYFCWYCERCLKLAGMKEISPNPCIQPTNTACCMQNGHNPLASTSGHVMVGLLGPEGPVHWSQKYHKTCLQSLLLCLCFSSA